MKWILAVVVVGLSAVNAFSADSTWFLCDNGAAVFNTVEHRSADGMGRETSIQMLIGVNVLQGLLVYTSSGDVDSGTVKLIGPEKSELSFTGGMTFDYSENVVLVNGNLNEGDVAVPINAKMKCKEMHASAL